MESYEIIFEWAWPLFGYKRLKQEQSDLALIYKWVFFFGPIEIRKRAS
jgi:hypothetical protein